MWNAVIKTDAWEIVLVAARGDTFPSYPEDDYEETNSTEVPIRSRSQQRILTPSPANFADIFSLLTPTSQVLDSTINDDPTPVISTAATPTTHYPLLPSTIKTPTITERTTSTADPTPTKAKDPDAEVCSGRPFDSFMQLKNGSMYAFRGKCLTAKNKNVNSIQNDFTFFIVVTCGQFWFICSVPVLPAWVPS